MKILILKKNFLYFFILLVVIISITIATFFTSTTTVVSYSFAELYDDYLTKNPKVLTAEKLSLVKNIYYQKEKIAYLTFDDGPTTKCTPKILDILKENNIKATFFVIGERVDECPNIVKRAYEEGHFIGNHTYSHRNQKIYNNKEAFLEELLKTDKAISNAIGIENYHSHLFRFPAGSTTNYSLKKKYINYLDDFDYTYIDWNCLNNDSLAKLSSSQMLKVLKNTSKNKNVLVVLMHDSGDLNDTSKVLQDSINYLKNQGYEFRCMKELFE